MDEETIMLDKQTKLINYLDSVIEQLNQIKTNPDAEIQNEYYSLACIAWRMEMFSIQGIRRRRGKNQDSDENE